MNNHNLVFRFVHFYIVFIALILYKYDSLLRKIIRVTYRRYFVREACAEALKLISIRSISSSKSLIYKRKSVGAIEDS